MTRTRLFLLSTLAATLVSSSPAQAALSKVVTYSGYLKTAAGVPVTTSTDLTFRLYTASSGGTAIWNDSVSVTPGADGWFSAPLGILNPLPLAILGQDLYLSLQVGAEAEFSQRARVTPSGAALTVDWSGVQGKPTCAAGQFLSLDSATGNLVCQTPAGGGGGFTPPSCTSGQVMKWNGSSWACAADDTGTAAIVHDASLAGTGVAGSPLGLMACADNQTLQRVAGTWTCTPALAAPVAVCVTGKVLTWTSTGFSCVADANNVYTAGAGLTLSGTQFASAFTTSGGTNGVASTVARGDHNHDFGVAGTKVTDYNSMINISGAVTSQFLVSSVIVAAGTSNTVVLNGQFSGEKLAVSSYSRYTVTLWRGAACSSGVLVGYAMYRPPTFAAATYSSDTWHSDSIPISGVDTGVTGTQTYSLCVAKFEASAADLSIGPRTLTATWSR